MKKNDVNSLMNDYKGLEKMAHVGIDDTINKVTQEVAELIEAYSNGDESEMYKEAGDVISNLYSVAHELGLNTEFDLENNLENEKTPIELIILLGKWNSKVQGLRSRYSREDIDSGEVQSITKEFVTEILNYSDPDLNIEQMIEKNIEKFKARVDNYKSNIDIKDYIVNYPNFPKAGIDFKDISPILKSPEAFRFVCMEMAKKCEDSDIIVGLDSRGFLFGTMIAEHLGKPFVMVRKQGKLAGKTTSQDYGLEYGTDVIELQDGSISKGQKVSIIDDLLATGGTAKAAIDLVEKSLGEVNNVSFVISLDEPGLSNLDSRKQLDSYNCNSVVSYK